MPHARRAPLRGTRSGEGTEDSSVLARLGQPISVHGRPRPARDASIGAIRIISGLLDPTPSAVPDTPVPSSAALFSVDAQMLQVDAVVRRRLASDVALIDQIAHYIIGAGGKRIRPRLVLMFAAALGFEGDERFELAAIVEFIHTATLLHDDVVDESSLRRGQIGRAHV